KASLSFQTGNSVGALANVLQCFAEQNVNLSKIQSMPVVGRRNEYDFYVDVEWKKQSDYDAAIRKVLKHTINFTIMGEYVKNEKVNGRRAGIWKPRTRPGEFEGIGSVGLEWLRRAKAETGLLTATEVATAKHVEEALAAGIDILWVGARSTANPFTVQEIADALQGVDVPVFVKNPVNPDLSLWIGALERINRAGIKKLGAIHRGFSSFEKTAFRNEPMWDLAVQLKSACPELPIINDSSHICG